MGQGTALRQALYEASLWLHGVAPEHLDGLAEEAEGVARQLRSAVVAWSEDARAAPWCGALADLAALAPELGADGAAAARDLADLAVGAPPRRDWVREAALGALLDAAPHLDAASSAKALAVLARARGTEARHPPRAGGRGGRTPVPREAAPGCARLLEADAYAAVLRATDAGAARAAGGAAAAARLAAQAAVAQAAEGARSGPAAAAMARCGAALGARAEAAAAGAVAAAARADAVGDGDPERVPSLEGRLEPLTPTPNRKLGEVRATAARHRAALEQLARFRSAARLTVATARLSTLALPRQGKAEAKPALPAVDAKPRRSPVAPRKPRGAAPPPWNSPLGRRAAPRPRPRPATAAPAPARPEPPPARAETPPPASRAPAADGVWLALWSDLPFRSGPYFWHTGTHTTAWRRPAEVAQGPGPAGPAGPPPPPPGAAAVVWAPAGAVSWVPLRVLAAPRGPAPPSPEV